MIGDVGGCDAITCNNIKSLPASDCLHDPCLPLKEPAGKVWSLQQAFRLGSRLLHTRPHLFPPLRVV